VALNVRICPKTKDIPGIVCKYEGSMIKLHGICIDVFTYILDYKERCHLPSENFDTDPAPTFYFTVMP
jgi:hypothetical protein